MVTASAGVSSLWDTLMGTQNQMQLSDQEEQARKKKIMAAGSGGMQSGAAQLLYGARGMPSYTPVG